MHTLQCALLPESRVLGTGLHHSQGLGWERREDLSSCGSVWESRLSVGTARLGGKHRHCSSEPDGKQRRARGPPGHRHKVPWSSSQSQLW